MKRKCSLMGRVAIALVLALSLCLMTAVPVGAQDGVYLQTEGNGVAEWSAETANSGSYSVKLSAPDSAASARPVIPYGGALSEIDSISFWIYIETADYFPGLATLEEYWADGVAREGYLAPYITLELDTSGDGFKDDWLILYHYGEDTKGEWVQRSLAEGFHTSMDELTGQSYWHSIMNASLATWPKPTVMGYVGNTGTLADWQGTILGDAIVLNIKIPLGEGPGFAGMEVYVDDIEINGVTYELEPALPVFDKDFYKVGDEPIVTIYDADANDPMAIDDITVHVVSTTDEVGDDVVLSEEESDTGVFTGFFTLLGEPPADRALDQIVVSEGDTITLTYDGVEVATATVDETAPEFTIVADGDYYKNTDTITLTATLDALGYTVSADFSSIDSEYTTGLEEFEDVGEGTYTITYAISDTNTKADGEYTIPVTAEDAAGNKDTYTEFSTTLDNTEPAVTDPTADPAVLQPSPSTLEVVIFSVSVSDGEGSGVDTVTIDLSSIGGGLSVSMIEVGTTGVYECDLADVSLAEADYPLPVTATDTVGNVNDTEAITLRVLLDVNPPVIVSTEVEYPVGAVSARVGDSVVITAVVTDDLAGVDEVTVDATGIEEDPQTMSLVAGTNTYSATLTIGTVDADTYTLPITATDLAGIEAEATVDVEVVISLTGYNIALVEGWNLVSLPLIPDVALIETVLADLIDAGTVDWVDTFVYEVDKLVEKKWDPPAILQNTEMSAGQGYWVNMIGDDTLTISGLELPAPPNVPPTYKVYEGWNLIGVKSVDPISVTEYLGEAVTLTLEAMYGYNADEGAYTVIVAATALDPGDGYWLAVNADGKIYPSGTSGG